MLQTNTTIGLCYLFVVGLLVGQFDTMKHSWTSWNMTLTEYLLTVILIYCSIIHLLYTTVD